MDRHLFKALRLDNGYSQAEFGKILGISDTSVYRIEKGERNITDRVRFQVLKHFEITPELLELVDKEKGISL